MALLALGQVPQPGAHAMRDQVIARGRPYPLDHVALLLGRKPFKNHEPHLISEEDVAQLLVGDGRVRQQRWDELGKCDHHMFAHVKLKHSLPLPWPLGRTDLHIKTQPVDSGDGVQHGGAALSRDRGLSSH